MYIFYVSQEIADFLGYILMIIISADYLNKIPVIKNVTRAVAVINNRKWK